MIDSKEDKWYEGGSFFKKTGRWIN